MNKKQIAITLGIMCFALSFGTALQIRTIDNSNLAAIQTLTDNDLRDNVLKWKEKYDNILGELTSKEEELEKVRQHATQDNLTASSKEEKLKRNNTMFGLTDVTGCGIIIEFQDGKMDNAFDNVASLIVHYEDLLSLVNELRNSGAEAIEINGQRIINTSAITCEGTVIKINGEKIGSPFTIKAIGSQGLLYGQMTRVGSYLDAMKSTGIDNITVKQSDDIKINKYSGTINFKYISNQ